MSDVSMSVSKGHSAEKGLPAFHPTWVPCVGCGVQIPLVNDPDDTPEPHRSQCLNLRTERVFPSAKGDRP